MDFDKILHYFAVGLVSVWFGILGVISLIFCVYHPLVILGMVSFIALAVGLGYIVNKFLTDLV